MQKQRKLGRGVAVVGVGISKFGVYPRGVRAQDLFVEAYNELKSSVDKGFDPKDIDALYLGNGCSDIMEHQLHTALALSPYGSPPRMWGTLTRICL